MAPCVPITGTYVGDHRWCLGIFGRYRCGPEYYNNSFLYLQWRRNIDLWVICSDVGLFSNHAFPNHLSYRHSFVGDIVFYELFITKAALGNEEFHKDVLL